MSTETDSSTESTTHPPVKLSQRGNLVSGQAISFLMQQAVENPQCISLAAGLVDQSTLPVAEARQSLSEILADDEFAQQVLQYGTTPGPQPIRESLLRHLARLENCAVEELGVSPAEVVTTTGSQQLLSLVAEVLFDLGDICLVAAPTYFVFLGVLNGVGARTISIHTDEHGMCPEALETELEKLEAAGELHRVKMIYLVSYYENPSGISLATDRRKQMVDIARRWSKDHRLFILEDAAYRELRYDGEEYPSVWSFDEEREHVILAQTFSKSFSPGVRVGFGVLPKELIAPVCDRKGNEDFGSAHLNQRLISHVLDSGRYVEHVEKVRESYRTKRDAMLTAADQYFTDIPGVSWVHPAGGLYVWMTVPESLATGFDSPLFHQATRIEEMMYVPGELCYAGPQRPCHQMRLSYGVQTPAGIDEGMKRLSKALKALL